MKQRLQLYVTPDDDQAAGDRVRVDWTGRHGTASPDQQVQVLEERVFGPRVRRPGKGITPKGRGGKGSGRVAAIMAGKGRAPKGVGGKGRTLPLVPVTLLVSPVTGLRTFQVATFDLAGNEQSSGNPQVTAMISAVPPRTGLARFDSYDAAADTVTVLAPGRMY